MTIYERFLQTELELRTREAERRGQFEVALAERRRSRPTPRQRLAVRLLALAHRLSPETVTLVEPDEPCLHA